MERSTAATETSWKVVVTGKFVEERSVFEESRGPRWIGLGVPRLRGPLAHAARAA